jgi:hypothetical protein
VLALGAGGFDFVPHLCVRPFVRVQQACRHLQVTACTRGSGVTQRRVDPPGLGRRVLRPELDCFAKAEEGLCVAFVRAGLLGCCQFHLCLSVEVDALGVLLVAAQCLLEGFDSLVPITRSRRHGGAGDFDEFAGLIGRCDFVLRDMAHAFGRARACVRGMAGDDLVQDCAKEVDIRPRADAEGIAGNHFGSHVRRRPADGAVREDVRPVCIEARGQSPVHQKDLAVFAEHDVLRLEILVQHPAGVREGGRVGHAHQDVEILVERALRELLVPGLAGDPLHRAEEVFLFVEAEFVYRGDVRVVEIGVNRCFGEELLLAPLIQRGGRLHHLDREMAVQAGLAGLVDHPHAPFSDAVEEFVVTETGLAFAVSRCRCEAAGLDCEAGLRSAVP